jgi:alkylation response protein AidB-like acyl-CoA dehydrogenase
MTAADFSEFHEELRSVAADLLAKDGDVAWPVLADAGWTGLEVPDEFGGAGAGFTEVAIVCEEIGRAAGATDYLGSVLAVGALNASAPSAVRDELLSGIAAGELRATVALDGFRLESGLLHGAAEFVPDAVGADRVLVVATADNGVPVLVDASALTVTDQPVLDETRNLARVCADGVDIPDSAVLSFEGIGFDALDDLFARAATAIACDSLGVAQAMLDATVSYVKVRSQFDRPIGSFQAVKHACADMQVALAVSRQLVTMAVDRVAKGEEAGTAASMAKAYATSAAVDVAGKAMQLHGGIGYTWESGIHVYLKRAALNRSLFGSPTAHRQKLAQRLAHKYRTRSY